MFIGVQSEPLFREFITGVRTLSSSVPAGGFRSQFFNRGRVYVTAVAR